jgi:hypothetical protein
MLKTTSGDAENIIPATHPVLIRLRSLEYLVKFWGVNLAVWNRKYRRSRAAGSLRENVPSIKRGYRLITSVLILEQACFLAAGQSYIVELSRLKGLLPRPGDLITKAAGAYNMVFQPRESFAL